MTDALKPDDTRDALRKIGGILFGVGVLMLLLRRGDDWADFPVFVAFAIPAVVLYGGGVMTVGETRGLRPWQAVFSVFGLLFVPLALFAFIELLDGNTDSSLNVFWVFGVTAALAFYAGVVAGIRFHLLAGAIAVIIAWSALWDELLGDEGIGGEIGIYRGLLGIVAILLIGFGIWIWRRDRDEGVWKFSELFTGAGIAAVIAGGFGITSAVNLVPIPISDFQAVETNLFWDLALLFISLGLIAVGSQIGSRGPVYVGAIGMTLFLFIVGLDLNNDPPDPTNLGIWPLILLIGGAVAIGASLLKDASLGNRPRDLVRQISGR